MILQNEDFHLMHKVDFSDFFIFVKYVLNDIDNNLQLKVISSLPH